MSGEPAPARTVVLVRNHHGREGLDDCLTSLAALDGFAAAGPDDSREPATRDLVVLVDRGSTDGSVGHVRERFPWVRVVGPEPAPGVGGYTEVIAGLEAEWVALLDADTRVGPTWLSALHRVARAHADVRAVASPILTWDGESYVFSGGDVAFTGHTRWRDREAAADPAAPSPTLLFGCSAALLLHRRTFLDVGGLDPDCPACGADVDLGWRLALAGFETRLAADAPVRRKPGRPSAALQEARCRFASERHALASVYKNFADERMGTLLLASAALAFLRAWLASASALPETRPYLTTDSLAHLLALAEVARLRPRLAARRAAVQATRRRTDAELQPLFGDLTHLAAALGPEYSEAHARVVNALGLEREGFGRRFPAEIDGAAEAAALTLASLCLEATQERFTAGAFLARGHDPDWEHALDAGVMARLRDAAAAVRALLASDLGLAAVATFAASLDRLGREGHKPPQPAGPIPSGDVWLPAGPVHPVPVAASVPARADDPEITVVVRTKDRPAALRRTLASVAAQRYAPLEVVVVNDGGADVSPATAAFGAELVVVNLRRTEGVGRTRAAQAGLEAATGEFVNLLDDDDELLPHHLRALVDVQRRTGARVVHSDAVTVVLEPDVAGRRRLVERGVVGGPLDRSRLWFENTLRLASVLVDRELALAAGGFDPALDCFEDWDLFLRLTRLARFVHCPEVTSRHLVPPTPAPGDAHRWPHLAAFFDRHREEIRGTDWARFYRDQVEAARDRTEELEARLREVDRARARAEESLAGLERSPLFRLARFARRLRGGD